MGRKAIEKNRKHNPQKKIQWVKQLTPFYMQNGLKDVTMDEVATFLNKSKATLYKYFSSREEIIEQILTVRLGEIQRFEELLTDEDIPYLQRYLKSIEHLFVHIGDISNRFLLDLKILYPQLWTLVKKLIKHTEKVLISYYEKGIELKIFQPVHPGLLALNDRLFFNILSDGQFLERYNLTIQEAFQQYFQMRFKGILQDQEQIDVHLSNPLAKVPELS